MPLTIKQESSFTPAPAGHHAAIVTKVIDLGHQEQTWEGKTTWPWKCFIEWELCEVYPEQTDEIPNPMPFTVARFLTVSLDKKSNMLPLLEGWSGKALSPERKLNFDLFKLLGASCYVNIIHDENGKAKVNSLNPPDEKSKSFTIQHDPMSFSFEDGGEIPEKLYDGIKNMIMNSREWNETGQQDEGWMQDEPPQHGPQDDIPF